MIRVVVVGGGLAGLATAWFLRTFAPPDLHLSVRVLERDAVAGGRVRTDRAERHVFEWGPHGFLDGAEDTDALIEGLALRDRLVRADDAARARYVLHGGELRRVPESPLALLRTPLLRARAKARLLLEPLVRKGKGVDESIASFAARRLGAGVVEPLLEPFVTGVFAGDPSRLSVRSSFPRLFALERQHGSLLRGVLARARARRRGAEGDASPRRRPTIHSFASGMGELPEALAAALADDLETGVAIERVRAASGGFVLEWSKDGVVQPAREADVMVVASPADRAAGILRSLDADLAATLETIPATGIAVACLSYARDALGAPLPGFGFLCARDRGEPSVLGAICASAVFPGHAPRERASLRVLMGGVHDPAALDLPPEALVARAHGALAPLLRLSAEPRTWRTYVHRRAIPQYTLGHHGRLLAIDTLLRRWPALFLTGQSYRGVGVNDVVRNARKTATHVVHHLLEAG